MLYSQLGLTGNSMIARQWVVESSLPREQQALLLTFIDRFPQLTFYRDDEQTLREYEAEALGNTDIASFPQWLRESRKIVALVMPGERVKVRFDTICEQNSLEQQIIYTYWHTLDLRGYFDEEDVAIFRHNGEITLIPIADTRDSEESGLAVNGDDPIDQGIYIYNRESLQTAKEEGFTIQESIKQIFTSYADLLAHITAIAVIQSGGGMTIHVAHKTE